MRIRVGLVVAVYVLSISATSCSSDDGAESGVAESASQSTSAVSTSVSPPPACDGADAEPTDGDTSIQDVLDANGVTDKTVCDLGEVTDNAGYGFGNRSTTFEERQGFAGIATDTCSEVASGFQTWDDVIDADVATGAPRSDSELLNGYLSDVYCPALSPETALVEREPGQSKPTRVVGSCLRSIGTQVDTSRCPQRIA